MQAWRSRAKVDTVLVGEPVEHLKEPTICVDLVEPLRLVGPFQDDARDALQVPQAAASNDAGESGRVWVFQVARTAKEQQEEALTKKHHEEALRKKATKKPRKKKRTKGRIPLKIRARLVTEARAEAARYGDRHPFDIGAVRTTAREAPKWGYLHQNRHLPERTPIYLIAMRGQFAIRCKQPKGRSCPHGWVLQFELVAETFERVPVDSFPLRYPNLVEFGTPARLRS